MTFRKLHIQLTTLFSIVTGLILTVMLCLCLCISYRDARENSYATFRNNINSILNYLSGQNVISHQWLLETEQMYHMKLQITDNHSPLFFQHLDETDRWQANFAGALSYQAQDLEDENVLPAQDDAPTHAEFSFTGADQTAYYASVAHLPRSAGQLQLVALYPLDLLHVRFAIQGLFFALADILGILLLTLFSWTYTRRLLTPLEQNQKSQSAFIAAASHELRTPLAVILSNLSALRAANPDEAKRFFKTIDAEGARMSRLIEDMLSLANADNHTWKIKPAPVELDTLLLQAYEAYEPLARQKGLKLTIQLPEEPLPPCTCDEARIAQVLSILIDNAISYTPSQGTISLALSKKGGHFQLFVSDDGPGVPDEQKSHIFQRFYRGDASHNDRSHFGLGLCIAWEILQLHKGDIRVLDAPTGGATFLVLLNAS